MKLSIASVAAMIATSSSVYGFAPQSNFVVKSPAATIAAPTTALYSTMADSGVPPATSVGEVEDGILPTKLPSDVGFDYVPLASALAAGDLAQADQITRDALIVISGAKEKGRSFVYWTEVKNIPNTDLATIERLWNQFSGGKFGYSVQKKKWKSSKGDFETFCQKIGWTTKDGDVERKKRWFGASEFIYDVKKAPEGHLPLTSALRGTSLIKKLLEHPVWDNDDWKKEP
jgi:hypothetical protein